MSRPCTGGCACGAVRYGIPGEPLARADCQCRDCQRKSGTGHGSCRSHNLSVPAFFAFSASPSTSLRSGPST
mgnify:CR=1 FL=1